MFFITMPLWLFIVGWLIIKGVSWITDSPGRTNVICWILGIFGAVVVLTVIISIIAMWVNWN